MGQGTNAGVGVSSARALVVFAIVGAIAAAGTIAEVVADIDEPYPAVLQPAFDGVPRAVDGRVTVSRVTVEATTEDGRSVEIDGEDLLARDPVMGFWVTTQLAASVRGENERVRLGDDERRWLLEHAEDAAHATVSEVGLRVERLAVLAGRVDDVVPVDVVTATLVEVGS